VYENKVTTLVDVKVRVPEKLVTVVELVNELWAGISTAAAELLRKEITANIATEPRRMLQKVRDAFN
jgi:hypothetical protein